MKLKNYDFLNARSFPIEFKYEDDIYSVIEVYGILSRSKSYSGEPIVFFDVTNFSTKDIFNLSIYRLKDFVSCFGHYDLMTEEELVSAVICTRKSDGDDYIILNEFNEYYEVSKVECDDIERVARISYYVEKDEFENIRTGKVRRDLVNDRVE